MFGGIYFQLILEAIASQKSLLESRTLELKEQIQTINSDSSSISTLQVLTKKLEVYMCALYIRQRSSLTGCVLIILTM